MTKTRARQVQRVVRAAVEVARTQRALASIRQCTSHDPVTKLRCELTDPHTVADTPHRHRLAGSVAVVAW